MLELHRLQVKVLREMALHPSRRFSDMMAVTGLTSDDFKFHLRKLVKLDLVAKNEEGLYELTPEGKELANRFDYAERAPIRQPKLTTATILSRANANTGQTEYLFHQRLRQPFYWYWGVIGQPVRWGETFEDAARHGLKEQTGLDVPVQFIGFYRQRDYEENTDELLEDKLFVIFKADSEGKETQNWPLANAEWMTASKYAEQKKKFKSCVDMLNIVENGQSSFKDNTSFYPQEQY
ncbi:NUDIX hydrolase [Candidatus Saccharibacteria bacterium]|nr:MAG: NUDIX hydrolase [Candidatus Saccharibacteria bacterium]